MDHFNSSLQAKLTFYLKNNNLAICWVSRKIRHTPNGNNQNWTQFQKTRLLQNWVFPVTSNRSRSGNYVHKLFRSLSLPKEWSQVTHIPACIKTGVAVATILSFTWGAVHYKTIPWPHTQTPKPKMSPIHCTFATSVFQDGSLPFHHTHKHSCPLQQASHTNIYQNQNFLMLSFLFCFVFSFFFSRLTEPK